MNVSQAVARVYASALVDLGEAENCLPRIVDDLLLAQAVSDQHPDFREFFLSPRIEPAAKKRALDAAITGHFDRPVHGLLHVLIDKRREGILDNIVDEFERYLDSREGRTHVHVTSARGLDDELRQNIIDKLQAALGSKEIKLHEIVEPRIIGGLILKVGDRVLDGSIRRRLRGLASSLTSDS